MNIKRYCKVKQVIFFLVSTTHSTVHLFVPKANTKMNHNIYTFFFFSKSLNNFLHLGSPILLGIISNKIFKLNVKIRHLSNTEFSDVAPLSAGRHHLSVPFFSSLMHKYVFARFRETWKFRLKPILCYGQGLIDMVSIITTWLRVWDDCGHCG